MNRLALALGVVTMAAMPAMAREPINTEKHINQVLLQGFIADQIADNCPTMSGRKFRALSELISLRDYALSKGYSADEVRAFVESKTEKARGKAEAAAWLKAQGAVPGKAQAYCQVGQAQIAKKSLIGALLRSSQ